MGNATEPGLTPAQSRDLQRIAGLMIPADATFGVPAASDPVIFADILASLGRDIPDVCDALSAFAHADLGHPDAEAVVTAFLATQGKAAAALGRVVLQCYYRDERVLRAHGHDARPPFPKGYTLEQGDWSLLDAVRNRPQLWRSA
jgi:hypothetical protein